MLILSFSIRMRVFCYIKIKNKGVEKMKRNRQEKGITLIALIITIIILIILTAVTLNNVIGTDLIGFAGSAAGNYIDAEKEEEEKISELISKGEEAGQIGGLGGSQDADDEKNIYTIELTAFSKKGEEIPIEVKKVTKTEDGTEVNDGLTYIYSLEDTEKAKKEEKTYTFDSLDETQTYTVNIRVEDADGNYGKTSVKMIPFMIGELCYRCVDGSTWSDILPYCDYDSDNKWYDLQPYSSPEEPVHFQSQNLTAEYDFDRGISLESR